MDLSISILKSCCMISFILFKSTSLSNLCVAVLPWLKQMPDRMCGSVPCMLHHLEINKRLEWNILRLTIWPGLLIPCFSSLSNALLIAPISLNLFKKDTQPHIHKSNNKLHVQLLMIASGVLLIWFLLRPIRTLKKFALKIHIPNSKFKISQKNQIKLIKCHTTFQ